MSSAPNTMVLWLYGTPVLDLSPHRGRGQPLARVRGRFRPEALNRWRINDPVLSTSLPLEDGRPDPVVLTRFLDGLLPEGPLREQLARRRGLLTYQVYQLLAEYGGDVAGAVSVLPRGERPDDRAGTYEPLDQDALEAILEAVPRQPLGNVEADDRISLAGVRAKTLLALLDGTWHRPRQGALSTHVVKVRPHDYPDLSETEPLGMALARATGAGDVDVDRVVAGEHVAVAVRRYDRHLVDGRVVRTHQEDALQALGREAHQKYQRDPGQDRGPRLSDIATLLRTYGADLEPLARRTALTVLVGDTDAHARNHSLLHDEDGSVRLAPAYDVAPTGKPHPRASSGVGDPVRWRSSGWPGSCHSCPSGHSSRRAPSMVTTTDQPPAAARTCTANLSPPAPAIGGAHRLQLCAAVVTTTGSRPLCCDTISPCPPPPAPAGTEPSCSPTRVAPARPGTRSSRPARGARAGPSAEATTGSASPASHVRRSCTSSTSQASRSSWARRRRRATWVRSARSEATR